MASTRSSRSSRRPSAAAARRSVEATPGTEPALPLTTTLIILALIAATTLLCWAGKVNGDAFVSLASAIVGGILVARGMSAQRRNNP